MLIGACINSVLHKNWTAGQNIVVFFVLQVDAPKPILYKHCLLRLAVVETTLWHNQLWLMQFTLII